MIRMLLFCPRCLQQHVDAPEPEKGWANPPHATHTCKFCGVSWRPCNENTEGVLNIPALEEKHRERILASHPAFYLRPEGRWSIPWTPEETARRFHEAYEQFAPQFGYQTRSETAKPWSEVPEGNKALMIAVIRNVLIEQASQLPQRQGEEE